MSVTKYMEYVCPKCYKQDNGEFYISIHTEEKDVVQKILNHKINKVTCKNCAHIFIVKMTSFLFHNKIKEYALYYNPTDLNSINERNKNLKKIVGENNYLLNPIKFDNWSDFLNEIIKREKVN